MSQVGRVQLGIRHLVTLDAIAKWGTAAAAADRLNVTPSAISHRLREAERRLGVALTVRDGSGIRLTEAAQRLNKSTERILDELSHAEVDAMRIGRGVGTIVRFGIGVYNYFSWLPDFLSYFRDHQPDIEIEVVGDSTHEPLQKLRDERVDIVLMPGKVAEKGVSALHGMSDELVCVMAPTHPLACRNHIEASDLENETHISYSTEILSGFEYDGFFRPGEHYPVKLVNMSVPEAVAELVSAGQGISILSRWAMEPRLQNGSLVSARLTAQGFALEWNVLCRDTGSKGEHIAITAATLAQYLSEASRGVSG